MDEKTDTTVEQYELLFCLHTANELIKTKQEISLEHNISKWPIPCLKQRQKLCNV